MSHVATVDIEIKDLDALGEACAALGLHLTRDKKSFKWWGKHEGDYPIPAGFTQEDLGNCDHCIGDPSNPRMYEIGVVKRRDGRPGYLLMWDFIDGALVAKCGPEMNHLRQGYAATVAIKAALRNGFQVRQTKLPNGKIQLQLRK